MARTAPVPNIPPIPGMNPGVFTMGGGGEGGGGRGKSGKGKGGKGGKGGKKGANGASGGGKSAAACRGTGNGGACPGHHRGKGSGRVAKGDPVDIVTGNVFTLPATDLSLPGALPLSIVRAYRSSAAGRDVGLGYGWSHSLAWEVEVRRGEVRVWTDEGTSVDFEALELNEGSSGPGGWVLVRGVEGYVLDTADGTWRVFKEEHGRRFLLSEIRDSFDNSIAVFHEQGRIVRVVDSAGREVRVRASRDGRIGGWEVKNALQRGRWVAFATYAYDDEGDLVSAIDAEGFKTAYVYDEAHLLLSHTSPVGLTFRFRYGRENRCVETWGAYPDGRDPSLAASAAEVLADGHTRAKGIYHCKFEYGDDGYCEVVDSIGVHRYFGNEFGTVDKAISGGGIFDRQFDEGGHVISYTDPAGGVTTWARDARGRPLRVTDPLGRVTSYEREPDGHIRSSVDPRGGVTTVDSFAGGIGWTDPAGAYFERRHERRGLTSETVGPNGGTTKYKYDDSGNLVEKIDALGAPTRWAYDSWGRCVEAQAASGATTHYAYDLRGDLLSVRKPDGSVVRYQYDGDRQCVAVADENGAVTRYVYGGFRRLCEIHEPGGAVTRMSYDREGRLVQVVNAAGEVHSIVLGVAGIVASERTFDGRSLSYAYDACGRLAVFVNGLGQKAEYKYDAAGQLVEQSYDDGRVERFEYDALGNLVRAENPDGVFEFERNAVGWVTAEKQTAGGRTITVALDYDLLGNVVGRTTSLGHSERRERDVMGQVLCVVLNGREGGREEVRFAYDTLGREVARVLPGGGRVDEAYDVRDRLAARHVSRASALGPSVTVEQAYQYSPGSELLVSWDRPRGVKRFEHEAGRLVASGEEQGAVERFRYDATGNLYERDGAERAYGPGNRLLRRGEERYVWDGDARLVRKEIEAEGRVEGVNYHWGANGLLEAVERPDGVRITFSYDPFARRVSKHIVRVSLQGKETVERSTRYVWDGDSLVHEITWFAPASVGAKVEERSYVWSDRGFPLAHRDARGEGPERVVNPYFHYLTDDIGVPAKLLAADGSVACDISRDAWGAFREAPGAVANTPLGFPGQYYDEETGLCYNRNRYYDPAAGRYISADPVGLLSGFNAFTYAENQPTRFVDPLGLMAHVKVSGVPGNERGYEGWSDGSRPPGAAPKAATDSAIQDAVDNAHRKFETRGDKKDTAGKCAEIEALSNQAKDIRGDLSKRPGWDNLSKEEQNAKVRNGLREQYRKGAKIQARDGDGKSMAPCNFCAQVSRELGIHPENINADPNAVGLNPKSAKGGTVHNDRAWSGKEVYGKGSPKTEDSSTAVVPSVGAGGGQTAQGRVVHHPPEKPPPGGHVPAGGQADGGGGANLYYDNDGNYIGPRDKSRKKK